MYHRGKRRSPSKGEGCHRISERQDGSQSDGKIVHDVYELNPISLSTVVIPKASGGYQTEKVWIVGHDDLVGWVFVCHLKGQQIKPHSGQLLVGMVILPINPSMYWALSQWLNYHGGLLQHSLSSSLGVHPQQITKKDMNIEMKG